MGFPLLNPSPEATAGVRKAVPDSQDGCTQPQSSGLEGGILGPFTFGVKAGCFAYWGFGFCLEVTLCDVQNLLLLLCSEHS